MAPLVPAFLLALAAGAAAGPLAARNCAQLPGSPDPNVRNQIYQVALSMHVNANVMLAMMSAAITESFCNNLDCGDKDSLGVFQQRPSIGVWGTADQIRNVTFATRSFLTVAIRIDQQQPGLDAGVLAQSVQEAEAGNQYTKNEGTARQFIALAAAAVGKNPPADPPSNPPPASSSKPPASGKPPATTAAPPPHHTTAAPPPPPEETTDGAPPTETTDGAPPPDATDLPPDTLPNSTVITIAESFPTVFPGDAPGATAFVPAGVFTVYGDLDGAARMAPPGLADGCAAVYVPVWGDNCLIVSAKFNLTLEAFYGLNPSIDSLCQNLLAGGPYCVETLAMQASASASLASASLTEAGGASATQAETATWLRPTDL